MDKNNLLQLMLIQEEEEDEEHMLLHHIFQKRRGIQNLFVKRREEGYFKLLIALLKTDDSKFRECFRLNLDQFHFVVALIRDDLTKPGTNAVPLPITAEEKLALTLRFMATGETFRSLAFAFRISHSYIITLVKETLLSMCKHLVPMFIPAPSTDVLERNAEEFWQR
nr:uncharacterized protein LOC111507039 [Leptinotarsa decemlineata]